MKQLALILLALFCALQPAALPAQAPSTAGTVAEPYRLGSGDEIRLTIFGLDSANGPYTIGDGGRLSIPLVGTIDAEGKTTVELETAIGEALKARQIIKDPSVTVQVVKYRPFYIMGEVQKPGQYAYAPGMTVLQAVSIAGGYTFRANEKKATIRRGTGGSGAKTAATPDTPIKPGDTIVIPEAWF
jgi:polysaccharide biosynthesis/export protein